MKNLTEELEGLTKALEKSVKKYRKKKNNLYDKKTID